MPILLPPAPDLDDDCDSIGPDVDIESVHDDTDENDDTARR